MLSVQVTNLGTIAILNLEGQVVIGETENLRNAVRSLSQTSSVVVDLARVNIIDAYGLGVMLDLREHTLAKGIRFELRNLSRPLMKIMQITRLDSVFQINPTVRSFPRAVRAHRPAA